MKPNWFFRNALGKQILTGLFGPLFIVASSGASGTGQSMASDPATAQASDEALTATASEANQDASASRPHVYSVINLAPEGGAAALLNEKGQAAFGSFFFPSGGFFDGDRLYDIGSLGNDNTVVQGLNNLGVVTGTSVNNIGPGGEVHGFKWTVAGGIRALPGPGGANAADINDRNQIVGSIPLPAMGISGRAVRWDPNGKIVNLGPLPTSLSEARTINNHAYAGGFSNIAPGDQIHATVWDPAGRQIDLGTAGGDRAFTLFVNEANQAAGYSDDTVANSQLGFFWSARSGVVMTGAHGPGARVVADFNDRGEVVGETSIPGGTAGYLWSRSRGLKLVPRGPGVRTDVSAINNRTEMVGRIELKGGGTRAVRWNGLTHPIDLTSRLYRPPAGLVLEVGAAINDAGVILAHSNAGLVLLRPGTRGTDAPVLGPVVGLPNSVNVGQEVRLSLGFVDNSRTQTHVATIDWGDACVSPHPLLRESGGVGEVTFQHRFCKAGIFLLTVRVADSGGRKTEVGREYRVDAAGVATTGGQ